MKVLSFGEILWDIIEGEAYIGGAPFNLAAHLAMMNIDTAFVSAVGDDELGARALEAMQSYSMDRSLVRTIHEKPTGTVIVELANDGQPAYTITEGVAWDAIRIDGTENDIIGGKPWDALCFGTLAQRTANNREALAHLVKLAGVPEVFYDVNLRQHYYTREWIEQSLNWATIVKLNDDEIRVLGNLLFEKSEPEADCARRIMDSFDVRHVLVTSGERGAGMYSGEQYIEAGAPKVAVADTVGAGDSFSAAFLAAHGSGCAPEKALQLGCIVGAFVASQRSAIPEYSADIRHRIGEMISR